MILMLLRHLHGLLGDAVNSRVLALMASLVFLLLGCARIYRPIELVATPPSMSSGGLTGQIALQPWGDNSRYQEKALKSNLRVLVLNLENRTEVEIQVLGLELPANASVLSPAEALKLVKQQPLLYLLYPLLPGLMVPGADTKGSYAPSDQAVFSALAVIGLAIGIPNAVVAATSNNRLGAYLKSHAWSPRPLGPGQGQRGLIFLRNPDPYSPLMVQVLYRNASGEQRVGLLCPGVALR